MTAPIPVLDRVARMMLTGRQIREARTLLGLSPSDLAKKVGCITTLGGRWAEENEDGSVLSEDVDFVFRRTLERLGVEFIPENGGGAGVRLRKGEA